jgi:mono/diheme cytochrome c family protein
MRFRCLALLLLAAPLPAADVPKHRADGDAAIEARRVLLKHCGECHGDADPKKRKGRLWVGDYDTLVGNAADRGPVPFVSLNGKDLRSQVLEFMQDGSMPPGGRARPSDDDIRAVKEWVKRGAGENREGEYPRAFDDDTVLRLLAADLELVGEKDREAKRYVSFAHLADKPAGEVWKAEQALVAALGGDPAEVYKGPLKPVLGSAGTLFRLDVKQLGWDGGGRNLFERTTAGNVGRQEPGNVQFRMIPFDLIQLEYPYSHEAADAGLKKAADAAVAAMNGHRKGDKAPLRQLRAVPFVRGNWLADALRRDGKPTALANDLAALKTLAAELETAKGRVGEGPAFAPFTGPELPADATAPSMWAWYQAGVAPKTPPFKFRPTLTGSPVADAGTVTLTVESDRELTVSLVEVQPEYVEVLPLDSGTGRTLPAGKASPVSPNRKNTLAVGLVKENTDRVVNYLLFAGPKSPAHRPPVVVRSRHDTSAIWRVLPDEQDAADAQPVVRTLSPVTVKRGN